MKIGLIQTRGIGDIIIAAPIAQEFIKNGHEVFWPIDEAFVEFASDAFPKINFLGVDTTINPVGTNEYYILNPLKQLNEHGCDDIYCLYSHYSGCDLPARNLAASLKFDEYKYAITGIPFLRKYKLEISRNRDREKYLIDQLNISDRYLVVHNEGSDFKREILLNDETKRQFQIITIDQSITKYPLDWLGVIEGASELHMIDSCFSNLVEQLNIKTRKYLYLRSPALSTPVYGSGWVFV